MWWKKKQPKEEYLEHKIMKRWFDEKDGSCCYTLYPRYLYIINKKQKEDLQTNLGNERYWSWRSYKNTEDDNIEVLKLRTVCWFEMKGRLAMSELTPGVTYECVYVVKLTKSAYSWEHPVTLILQVPDEQNKIRQRSLLTEHKDVWFELNLGSFQAKPPHPNDHNKEIVFNFTCISGQWKQGLIFKYVIFRPKHY